jgi:hypothetical protein
VTEHLSKRHDFFQAAVAAPQKLDILLRAHKRPFSFRCHFGTRYLPYAGNSLLLFFGFVVVASGDADNLVIGTILGALAALNLFLIYKLDRLVWLTHELEVTKMRQELVAVRKRLGELEASLPFRTND